MPQPNLYQAVRTCSKENWSSTGVWLAYTLGYGFLPVWIGFVLVFVLSHEHLKMADFIVHGEFAIYSATLVAGSTRLISRDTDLGPFVHRSMFVLIAGLSLAITVTIYVAIKAALFFHLQDIINGRSIIWVSVPLVVFSVVFAFLVFLLDQQRFHPNVAAISRQQVNDLVDQYDKLGGNDGQ